MQHLDEGTIHTWLDDALPADEVARVAEHVASCAACADAVAEARGLIAASSRILRALDVVPGDVIPVSRPATSIRLARPWFRRRTLSLAAGFVVMAVSSAIAVRTWRTAAPAKAVSVAPESSPVQSAVVPEKMPRPAAIPKESAKASEPARAKRNVPAAAPLENKIELLKPSPVVSPVPSPAPPQVAKMAQGAVANVAADTVSNAMGFSARDAVRDSAPETAGARSKLRIRGFSGISAPLSAVVTTSVGPQRRIQLPQRQARCDSVEVAEYVVENVVVRVASGAVIPPAGAATACLGADTARAEVRAVVTERRQSKGAVALTTVPTDTLTWRSADGRRGYRLEGRATRAKLEQIRDLLGIAP